MCRDWTFRPVVMLVVLALPVRVSNLVRADEGTPQAEPGGKTLRDAYSLQIEPEDELLRSGARYTLSLQGKQAWSGRKPYTLRDHAITTEGWVVGVAYSTSRRRPPGGGKRKLFFHVVILDPTGREILNDMTVRRPGPPVKVGVFQDVPFARQLLVDPDNDRIIIRGQDDGTPGDARNDFWWTFRLSTGEALTRTRLMTDRSKQLDPVRQVFHTALVAGTPLVVVHWFIPFGGARFTLVTPDDRQIWALDFDEDYHDLDDTARQNVSKYVAEHPGLLETDQRGQFTIRNLAKNQQITYAVSPATETEWFVKQVSRVEYVEPPAPANPNLRQDANATGE